MRVGLFSRREKQKANRLFFATDLHGSSVCFRKFVNAPSAYEAQTVIMGGDCTGKVMVPIVECGDGGRCEWHGVQLELNDDAEIEAVEAQISDAGCYPVRVTEEEFAALADSTDLKDARFSALMRQRLAEWCEFAEGRLGGTDVQMVASPGNDDEFEIDAVIADAEYVVAGEGRIVTIGPHEMLSLSWSNLTPWDTPRECSEQDLAAKIDQAAAEIKDMENAIFNIHVPPYGTGLDEAPELGAGQEVVAGSMVAVGSTAVRDAILRYQPLLTLHGHIHESRSVQRLGRTTSINPGSVYSDGTLQGVVVDLEPGRVVGYSLTSG
jgi:Icc-related predicted phosphoesterase